MAAIARSSDDILSTINEDFLKCKICFSRFHTPKCLPCLHTYCESCLETYINGTLFSDDKGISRFFCPICRKRIRVPSGRAAGFPTNFMINDLDDTLTPKRHECVVCCSAGKAATATTRCKECDFYMCSSCSKTHCRARKSHKHKLEKLPKVKSASLAKITCSDHKTKEATFYCRHCNSFFCTECQTKNHKQHQVTATHTATQLQAKEIRQLLDCLELAKSSQIKNLEKADRDYKHLLREKQKLQSSVRAQAQVVVKYAEMLCQKIDQCYKPAIKNCIIEKDEVTKSYEELDTNIQTAIRIIDSNSPADDSWVKKTVIDNLLHMVRKSKTNAKVPPPSKPPQIKYTASEIPVHVLTKYIGKIEMATEEDPVVSKLYSFKLDIDQGNDLGLGHIGLSRDEESVYVTDQFSKTIKIFDIKGQFISSFDQTSDKGATPRSLCTLADGNILVGYSNSDGKMNIYDKNGKFKSGLKTPANSNPSVGETSTGSLFVSDFKSGKVHVCFSDGRGAGTLSLGSDIPCPVYMHLDQDNNIFISTYNDAVHKFDQEGHQLFTYHKENRQDFSPLGICTDSNKNCLIADPLHHQVHLITKEGRFLKHILREEDGIWGPSDVALTSDSKLLVSHYDEKGQAYISLYDYNMGPQLEEELKNCNVKQDKF